MDRPALHASRPADIGDFQVASDEVKTGAKRRWRMIAGGCITTVGIVLVLFCAFQFAGSKLVAAKGQKELITSFRKSLEALKASGSTTAAPLAPGRPMGILRIPALGVEAVIVEGTRPQDLEKGPGHLRTSRLPGGRGNSVLAGRRTTFTSVFARINELQPGDHVIVTTTHGASKYRVTGSKTVAAGNPDVIGRTADSRLTLITSHPKYLANKRLAVTARLQGDARRLPSEAGPVVVERQETGLSGDTSALGPVVIWAELLAAVLAGTWFAYRRWPRRATYLVTTPVILAALYMLFTQISRLLPATL